MAGTGSYPWADGHIVKHGGLNNLAEGGLALVTRDRMTNGGYNSATDCLGSDWASRYIYGQTSYTATNWLKIDPGGTGTGSMVVYFACQIYGTDGTAAGSSYHEFRWKNTGGTSPALEVRNTQEGTNGITNGFSVYYSAGAGNYKNISGTILLPVEPGSLYHYGRNSAATGSFNITNFALYDPYRIYWSPTADMVDNYT